MTAAATERMVARAARGRWLGTSRTAQAAALRIGASAPVSDDRRRLAVTALARDLGAVVTLRPDLDVRARWHAYCDECPSKPRLWHDARHEINEIQVHSRLRGSARRFALAHELGHMVLHQQFDGLAAKLTIRSREQFANTFARELLVPPGIRAEVRAELRAVSDPIHLLKLADSLGVSPRTLLHFATWGRDWLRGLDTVWLDMRYMVNAHTGHDPRVRVHRAFLDGDRWYVPRNRSSIKLFGDDWLESVSGWACERRGAIDISRRRPVTPRYQRAEVPARLRAVRLRGVTGAGGAQFLASAELNAS